MGIPDIRLECLRLAATKASDPERTVQIARQWSDFVLGTHDAEIVQKAGEIASLVSRRA